jgi:predicted negative regulator of RcsB-dependent stress response
VARLKVEKAQPEEAAKYLEQVMEDSRSEEIRLIARHRLARLLVQEEKFDEALKVLTPPKGSAFAPAFHEARGDAYYAMGKMAEARTEYEEALKGRDPTTGDEAFLQAKLDEVAGLAPGAPAAAADASKPD